MTVKFQSIVLSFVLVAYSTTNAFGQQGISKRIATAAYNYSELRDSVYEALEDTRLYPRQYAKEFRRYDEFASNRLSIDQNGNVNLNAYKSLIAEYLDEPVCDDGGDWKEKGPFFNTTVLMGQINGWGV